jgi:hypothetical protein
MATPVIHFTRFEKRRKYKINSEPSSNKKERIDFCDRYSPSDTSRTYKIKRTPDNLLFDNKALP